MILKIRIVKYNKQKRLWQNWKKVIIINSLFWIICVQRTKFNNNDNNDSDTDSNNNDYDTDTNNNCNDYGDDNNNKIDITKQMQR